jgi:hypothetical protein
MPKRAAPAIREMLDTFVMVPSVVLFNEAFREPFPPPSM